MDRKEATLSVNQYTLKELISYTESNPLSGIYSDVARNLCIKNDLKTKEALILSKYLLCYVHKSS